MSFIELATKRYSVRKFTKQPVEKEKISLILRAGQLSPTAVNYQPQRILIIESESALEKLKACTVHHFNAPMAILICYDQNIAWCREFDHKSSGDIDASIVATHMMLQIADLGLGTTWVGDFNPDKIAHMFNLPKSILPVALLPVGYPSAASSPNPVHNKRYALEQTVCFNHF